MICQSETIHVFLAARADNQLAATPDALELPRNSTATNRQEPPRSGRLVVMEEAIFPSQTKEIANNRG